jgi:hypothetical protein
MADMSWFYVVVALMNHSGFQSFGDAIANIPAETTKVQLAMPDEATCEAIRALNKAGECWAKAAEKKESVPALGLRSLDTDTYSNFCVPTMMPFSAPFNNSFEKPQRP